MREILGSATTLVLVASVLLASLLGFSACAAERPVQLSGILKKADGSPAAGEIVYFAAVNEGRISTSFKLEGGSTTGLVNPHAQTDRNGRFTILVDSAELAGGREFTIGILDCERCFVNPSRRLMRGGLPLTIRLAPPDNAPAARVNLGEITLGGR